MIKDMFKITTGDLTNATNLYQTLIKAMRSIAENTWTNLWLRPLTFVIWWNQALSEIEIEPYHLMIKTNRDVAGDKWIKFINRGVN